MKELYKAYGLPGVYTREELVEMSLRDNVNYLEGAERVEE